MYQRTRVVLRSAILALAVVATAATGGSSNTAEAHEADWSARLQMPKPKKLNFNPDDHVGKWFNRKVKDFVIHDMADGFQPAEDFYLAPQNVLCALKISVAKSSSGVDKKVDASNPNGFIVALIANPNDCKPDAFDLARQDTAVWYVRFENAQTIDDGKRHDATNGTKVGKSSLILLQRNGWDNDYWFPKKKEWSLGYCNHTPRPNATDQALVVTYASACTAVNSLGHNAHDISLLQREEAVRLAAQIKSGASPTQRVLVAGDDLALWFACGGDCCYASFDR